MDYIEITEPCDEDFNDDHWVNASDLLIMLGFWGKCDLCDADLNQDGDVGTLDLLLLLGNWGPCE